MKLYLYGNDYKYAAEQILLTLFPAERPEYPEGEPEGDDRAEITFTEGKNRVTARTRIFYGGKTAAGYSHADKSAMADPLGEDREQQKILKLSFYNAAVKLLGSEPPWGALTGVRPVTIMTGMLENGFSRSDAVKRMERLYRVSSSRARLCADTAEASIKIQSAIGPRDVGLYVGIPFCPTRCAYCSFVSSDVAKTMKLVEPYLEALKAEITAIGRLLEGRGARVTALYIGGGTPTTLTAPQLEGLISHIRKSLDLSHLSEFSVEAGRPDTVTPDKLKVLKDGGVHRISINPQTLSDEVLSAIGRRHTADDFRRAWAMAREYFPGAINADLIAGLPRDTAESFAASLDELITLDAENITVHTLALKKGSKITLGGVPVPSGEEVGAMLDYALDRLTAAGYAPYYLYRQKFISGGFENVGWAKPGQECLYNVMIMDEAAPVIGAGAGATSKFTDRSTGAIERITNKKYPQEYISAIGEIRDKKLSAGPMLFPGG